MGQLPGILGSFAHEICRERKDADDDSPRSERYARADSAVRRVLSRALRAACAGGIRNVSEGESRLRRAAPHSGPLAAILGLLREVPEQSPGDRVEGNGRSFEQGPTAKLAIILHASVGLVSNASERKRKRGRPTGLPRFLLSGSSEETAERS